MSQLNQSQGVTADIFCFENTYLILPGLKIQTSKQKQFSDRVVQIIGNPGKLSEISCQIIANISKL